jgi:hypothetical protein
MRNWGKPSMCVGSRRAASAALAVLMGGALPASTYAETAALPMFGMVGIARGQDAVLSLVLVHPPDPDHPGCRVTASFVDARGEVVHDARGNPVQQTFHLRDHVSAALTLRGADVLGTQLRVPIRAELKAAPNDGTASDCKCLMATKELVGLDGRTNSHHDGQLPSGGGNPPPPPPVCVIPAFEIPSR